MQCDSGIVFLYPIITSNLTHHILRDYVYTCIYITCRMGPRLMSIGFWSDYPRAPPFATADSDFRTIHRMLIIKGSSSED